MRITIQRNDYEKMLEHALKERPNEACGLIAGIDHEDGTREICFIYLLTNTDASSEHFTLDPREQLAAVRNMRENGWKPLGNWHSHPESPSRPSEEDKRLAFDKTASYLILSLMDEKEPVLNSFHVENGISEKEDLEILD